MRFVAIHEGAAVIPLSCAYCSHNPLQYGSLGLIAGYCVRHNVVLRHADETTCGQQLRKDLAAETREIAQAQQRKSFRTDLVQLLRSGKPLDKQPRL